MDTVLESLIASLRARNVAPDGQAPPAAIVWTDPKREWLPLVDMFLEHVEEYLVLGEYDAERRTGPAVWLRCIVDGTLEQPRLPRDRPPIVYVPGVARQDLRAGEECPDRLKPLVELLYRGALWHHPNGGDWTVNAFLTSRTALGLDVAGDRTTADALQRALPEVALAPVAQLAGRQLAADDFDRMLAGDVIRDLLRWLGDPDTARGRMGANGWEAFRARCREELDFDPEHEADVVAGARLAQGDGVWAAVWARFAEAPERYGDIAGVLRRSQPSGGFRFDRERWPDLNEEDEDTVRRALTGLPKLRHDAACTAVVDLEREHGGRRNSVWSRLELAPMAAVLEPLASLATAVQRVVGGTEPAEAAKGYLEYGWRADRGAWQALALAPAADERCIVEAVRHLLAPWLDESARAFQAAVGRSPLPGCGRQPPVEAEEDGCIVFVDGLRFDLALGLAERLEGRGFRIDLRRRWAGLPTVTGTAKPAVTPVAEHVVGDVLGQDFTAHMRDSHKTADASTLRVAMEAGGYQILGGDSQDVPRSHPARGWLETGEFDSLGHKLGAVKFAGQLDKEIEHLAERIAGLLGAGWTAVRVVTDHGWLLLPGGLPKVDLPKHLTESRWARCAVIAGEAAPDVPRSPWHWNPTQWFATASGSACFNKSEEYAHGGLSIQECLIPDLVVTRAGDETVTAAISSVTWRGLRCVIKAEVRGGQATGDIRLQRPSGESVAAKPKQVDPDGTVSLVLADDEHEGSELVLVLLDEAGRVLAQQPTRVGVEG